MLLNDTLFTLVYLRDQKSKCTRTTEHLALKIVRDTVHLLQVSLSRSDYKPDEHYPLHMTLCPVNAIL